MAEPSVLLVDEDPRRRRALEVGLRRVGFRVTVAASAEQALWFLDHALPEVIVSTSHFSQGMSSLSLAEMIRGESCGHRTCLEWQKTMGWYCSKAAL